MVPEPGRGRGKPPLGKMKRKAPSPRLEAAATYQAWAADDEGSPRGSKPPIKKLRERLASVDVLDEVQAEASWGPLEGTAAVVSPPTAAMDVEAAAPPPASPPVLPAVAPPPVLEEERAV
jgi:hypothetical protein